MLCKLLETPLPKLIAFFAGAIANTDELFYFISYANINIVSLKGVSLDNPVCNVWPIKREN